jgi:hypothetical protein
MNKLSNELYIYTLLTQRDELLKSYPNLLSKQLQIDQLLYGVDCPLERSRITMNELSKNLKEEFLPAVFKLQELKRRLNAVETDLDLNAS